MHGGPFALAGCVLALFFRGTRVWGLGGLASLGIVTAALGPLPLPGEAPPLPAEWISAWGTLIPGGCPEGLSQWIALGLLAGGLGLGALAARFPPFLLVSLALVAASPLGPGLPVTNLPPEPAAELVASLPPGGVLHWPDPASPYFQGPHTVGSLLLLAARHGHPVWVGSGDPPDPALVAVLSRAADMPVDQGAAPLLWESRGEEPLARARALGFVAILVDTRFLADADRQRVGAVLQRLVGPPIGEGVEWTVYPVRDRMGP